MARYGMAIDTRRCVGCMDCVVACQTENNVPYGYHRNWITTVVKGKFPELAMEIRSERCNHCDNPPCVPVCPTGASHVAEGGIVKVTREKCIACGLCIQACPYKARYMHPDNFADKCTFCDHRVKVGQDPACAAVCPTYAITFGDLADPKSKVASLLKARKHHVLKPEAGTKPNIFYLT
jgi:Fe-S-cluster-containing dehydrogenase component